MVGVSEQSHGLADALLYALTDCPRANGGEHVTVDYERHESVLLGFLPGREPVSLSTLTYRRTSSNGSPGKAEVTSQRLSLSDCANITRSNIETCSKYRGAFWHAFTDFIREIRPSAVSYWMGFPKSVRSFSLGSTMRFVRS